jgi:hypothetical protein
MLEKLVAGVVFFDQRVFARRNIDDPALHAPGVDERQDPNAPLLPFDVHACTLTRAPLRRSDAFHIVLPG